MSVPCYSVAVIRCSQITGGREGVVQPAKRAGGARENNRGHSFSLILPFCPSHGTDRAATGNLDEHCHIRDCLSTNSTKASERAALARSDMQGLEPGVLASDLREAGLRGLAERLEAAKHTAEEGYWS